MYRSTVLTKEKIKNQLALIGWCIVYIISVNTILSEYYLAGSVEVVPYYKHFSIYKTIICFILTECCYYLTIKCKSDNKLLENIKKLLFVIFTIPIIFSYALFKQEFSLQFMIYGILYWIMFCFYCKFWRFKIKVKYALGWIHNKTIDRIWQIMITGALLFFMIKSLGGVKLSISLTDVYTTRQEFKETGNYTLTVLKTALGAYILPWMIVRFLSEKKYMIGMAFALGEVIVFSMAKDKMYLLLLLLSLGIGILGKFFLENGKNWFRTAMLFLSGINIAALLGIAQNLIFNVFTRRFFVMPTWLQYVNFEYFYDKTKLWWRQDTFFIDKLFTPVYSRSAIEMISNDYFRGWITNPNCGLVGEAFTRCGFLGFIIYPLLLVILIRFISIFFKSSNDKMLFIFSFALSSTIANDTITSTGFVATMLAVLFYAYFAGGNYNKKEMFEVFAMRNAK